MIAEPQRAFAGNQFGLVFPVLVHYGVSLWVPEVGGRVDPESEAHDLLMNLFGGLAKAERNRIRHRVRVAMAAHAAGGRWLGGRPPYGYRLVDAALHPNPEKAIAGVHIRELAPDPATSDVVRQIFDLYVNSGLGFKAIARELDAAGIPCPSAHDPARNTHRSGHAWASSAVRAILANPRYLGRHVFGRQRRKEQLVDPTQPALGHTTRMHWQARDEWVFSEDETHLPLVDEALWRQAQLLMSQRGRGRGGGSPRSERGRYVLVSVIECGHCGRRMQGSHTRGSAYYRCRLVAGDYASAPANHPPSLNVREDRVLRVLDRWLIDLLADDDHLQEVAQQVVAADELARHSAAAAASATRSIAGARQRIDRLMASLEAGVDAALVAERIKSAQQEIQGAEAILRSLPPAPPPLELADVVSTLTELRRLPARLDDASPEVRADLYRSMGIKVAYRRETNREIIQVSARLRAVDLERVGGGT